MSDAAEKQEPGEPGTVPGAAVVKDRSVRGPVLCALLMLVAIGVSAYVYYQVHELQSTVRQIPGLLAPFEARLLDLEKNTAAATLHTRQQQGVLTDLEARQEKLSEAFAALYREQDRGNSDWALAEIEHLLVLATQRLALEHNTDLALAAMEAADDRLKNNLDPGVLPLRRQLVTDMNALRAVASVDISGLALYLSDLVERVNNLPLQQVKISTANEPEPAREDSSSNWRKMRAAVWRELKSLVQISRQGDDTIATLLPTQQYFLYQNLRLQLESARFAVLRRDTENLHAAADIIARWLRDYFDTGNGEVTNIIESLSRMAELELNPPLPDISSSLESVRAYIRSSDGTTESAPVQPVE